MEKVYVVQYSSGSYEDRFVEIIFATTKKTTATKYVTKYNKILKKWKDYYKQYEDNNRGINWISDKYIDKYFERWYNLGKLNKCYYEEIILR